MYQYMLAQKMEHQTKTWQMDTFEAWQKIESMKPYSMKDKMDSIQESDHIDI